VNCTRTHILVTGASSGIGRATALRLAAADHHVYAGVRTEADGKDLVHAAEGGEVSAVLLDVTDADQIAAACAAVTEHVGGAGLEGLVDNAGIGVAAPTELLRLDAFRRLLEINLIGQLAVTQAFLPLLRLARGRIVVISTIGVRFRPPFAGPLDATKAALSELAHALRQELAPWGVRVILVEPASIASPAADKVARDAAGTLAAAEPDRRVLYEKTFTHMIGVMMRREKNGSSPDVVARTIARALTETRPRSTYLTGRYARRMATISRLPVPVLDAIRRRIFGLPAPGSFVEASSSDRPAVTAGRGG
jgi:NAD(P)-dependent dehydrogenase (short-subunit alcohol dehydrogenase family)